jgi:hypothetical protein
MYNSCTNHVYYCYTAANDLDLDTLDFLSFLFGSESGSTCKCAKHDRGAMSAPAKGQWRTAIKCRAYSGYESDSRTRRSA